MEEIEGLDNLRELRQLNLSDNMLKKVSGLAGCSVLDTLYLKNNRLGYCQDGEIAAL